MRDTFGTRLKSLAERQGLSQARLAELAETTQPAVSQFMRDDRLPRTDTLQKLAAALKCDPLWLLSGESPGRVDVVHPAPTAAPQWHFKETYGDGTRLYGNSATEVFDSNLSILTREIGQNSSDAALDGEARLEFSVIELTGQDLTAFLETIKWNELLPHYKAIASDTRHRHAQRVQRALEDLERGQKLLLFRVADYNATGLLGGEWDDGCFTALVRRAEDSSKQGETAGGRFGLGSNVFSLLSDFDLVAFASDLAEPEPESGRWRSRFIARTFLPFHALRSGGKEAEFEGHCFFGAQGKTERQRVSVWDADAILESLQMSRKLPDDFDGNETGSTILVVGFRSPNDDSEAPILDTLNGIKLAAAEYFWPAMAAGRLSIAVSHYENRKLVNRGLVDPTDYVPDLVSLAQDFNAGAVTVASPQVDVDVSRRAITLEVPKRLDNVREAGQHEAVLLVKKIGDDRGTIAKANHLNEVAMWRGPQMVVEYQKFTNLPFGATPFQAVLICGRAVGQLEEDTAADLFLAASEPPAHNKWDPENRDIRLKYVRGGPTALRGFFKRLRDAITEIVVERVERQKSGPRDLADMLSIPDETTAPKGGIRVLNLERVVHEGAKAIEVSVRCPRSQKTTWAFVPVMMSESESGGPVKIDAALRPGRNCSVNGSVINVSDASREVTFVMVPDWQHSDVDEQFAAIFVDISEVKRDLAGEAA